MEPRAISDRITETERLLNESRSRLEEQRNAIARRKAIGGNLKESVELLKNLQTSVSLRERHLRYLRRWLAGN
jgi:hypothetical protein